LRIGADPAAQRLGLADVEHLAVGRDHAIDARLARQRVHEIADDSHAVGQRSFAGRRGIARFLFDVGFVDHGVWGNL
jgi:hypothetical protein